MRRWLTLSIVATLAWLSAVGVAQEPVGGVRATAPVGVRGQVAEVVLPKGLEVRPLERGEPLLLRIVTSSPHGTLERYDLEFQGFEPGGYDLASYLRRPDGAPVELPEVRVEITSSLPPGQVEPSELETATPPRIGGYVIALWVLGGLWVVGLGVILFGFRKRRVATAIADAPPRRTLAERLRPMVEAAMRGDLEDDRKAELERLLIAHWDRRLGLQGRPASEALATLREHPEAGPLVRQLEEWLHRPGRGEAVDVEALLAPYREVADASSPATPGQVEELRR